MEITTSSKTSSPFFSMPTCSVCVACLDKSLDGNNPFTILILSGPLNLITASAPMPGAVASATMVSSQPVNLLSIPANIVDRIQLTVDRKKTTVNCQLRTVN